MRNRNYHVYRDNQAELEALAEEYKYIGRYVRLEPGMLTVLALPPKREVRKKIVRKSHRES